MNSKFVIRIQLNVLMFLLAGYSVCIAEEKTKSSKLTEKDAASEFFVSIGGLPDADKIWLKQIQDKHDRIVKQLEEVKDDKEVKVERYTREEAIAAIAFRISAATTARLQAKQDGVPAPTWAQANELFAKNPLRLIDSLKRKRMKEIQSKIELIMSDKVNLKSAMLADDTSRLDKWTEQIERDQRELRQLIAAPVSTDNLNMLALAEGQIGKMSRYGYRILQVIDQKEGKALIYNSLEDLPTVRIKGADLANLADDSNFPANRVFAVLGTAQYETVAGRIKTIF